MQSIKVKPGQTVFDISIQEYGGISAAFAIAGVNGISISSTPPESLFLPDGIDVNQPVKQRIMASGIIPASDISGLDLGGIGIMCIEFDFKVY